MNILNVKRLNVSPKVEIKKKVTVLLLSTQHLKKMFSQDSAIRKRYNLHPF